MTRCCRRVRHRPLPIRFAPHRQPPRPQRSTTALHRLTHICSTQASASLDSAISNPSSPQPAPRLPAPTRSLLGPTSHRLPPRRCSASPMAPTRTMDNRLRRTRQLLLMALLLSAPSPPHHPSAHSPPPHLLVPAQQQSHSTLRSLSHPQHHRRPSLQRAMQPRTSSHQPAPTRSPTAIQTSSHHALTPTGLLLSTYQRSWRRYCPRIRLSQTCIRMCRLLTPQSTSSSLSTHSRNSRLSSSSSNSSTSVYPPGRPLRRVAVAFSLV